MAIATWIAGPYNATIDAVALGVTDEGYDLAWEPKVEAINKTDLWADSFLDGVFRGSAWFLTAEFKEWQPTTIAAAWPWGPAIGLQGVVGRLMSDVALPVVLTAVAGTSATPATLTAPLAVLAENSNPHSVFNPRLRTIPVRLVLLPDDDAETPQDLTYFVTT